VRDREGGRVTVDQDGQPISHYSLSAFDRKHLRQGFIGAARILEASGAELIFSPHAKWCAYEPGRRGSLVSLIQDMDSAGWDAAQLALFSFHIMGTARMGGSPRTSATNPEGETWEVRKPLCNGRVRLPQRVGRKPYDFHRGDSAPQRLGLSVAIASSIELVILPANRPAEWGLLDLFRFYPSL